MPRRDRERIDMEWQIGATAFSQASMRTTQRARELLRIEGGDRCQDAKYGVAIVWRRRARRVSRRGSPAPTDRGPSCPSGELRLLVEVTVEQHAIVDLPGNVDEQEGSVPRCDGSRPSCHRSAAPGTSAPSIGSRPPCARVVPTAGRTGRLDSECARTRRAAGRWISATALAIDSLEPGPNQAYT